MLGQKLHLPNLEVLSSNLYDSELVYGLPESKVLDDSYKSLKGNYYKPRTILILLLSFKFWIT
jgi:hypothetical protein